MADFKNNDEYLLLPDMTDGIPYYILVGENAGQALCGYAFANGQAQIDCFRKAVSVVNERGRKVAGAVNPELTAKAIMKVAYEKLS